MTRICKHCGTPVPRETSRFCAGCGRPLSQEDIVVTGNMNTAVQQPTQQPYQQPQSYQQPAQQPNQKRTPSVHYSSQSQYAGQQQTQAQPQTTQPQPQQRTSVPNQTAPAQNQAYYPSQEQRTPQLTIQSQPQPQPQQVQPPVSQQPRPQQQAQSWQGQAQQVAQHAQSAMKVINGIMTVTASSAPGEMVVGEFGPDIIGIVTNAAANAARSAGAAVMNTAQQQLRQPQQTQYPQQGQWQGQPQQMPPQRNYQNGQRR